MAIIGLSGRYPQANSLEEFWHNLAHGVDCVTEVPAERWDHSRYFDPEKGKLGKSYSKWGAGSSMAWIGSIRCSSTSLRAKPW
ncbi:beta-ketoacyl synthase N-terminal-like domain-containing protein [Variovorax sp. NFACC26]|uniref:beta-ketoacyl synthase N-terminal-like domain-containing protein n=1 Tax=Variovorax sp. NFACC26 TaxID=1566275 RepID=UPI003AAD6024